MPEDSIQQNIFGSGNITVGRGTINIVQQLPELDREGNRSLAILRDKVKQFWIAGVLERSVHGSALIDLGKETMAQAVDHPWASTLELPERETQPIPQSKKTSDVFFECGRALLILGEPGSGKTISLLEMARDLIQKSERDPMQPAPVIFNLSSFSARKGTLLAWLIDELRTKYLVSRDMAELWLRENRLLLMLDGLDEVDADARTLCVEAIRAHIVENGSSGIAVCCRVRDYAALPVKLNLNAAICIQPLTREQIDRYLQQSGESLQFLRQSVNDDPVLSELAESPLMLSIMMLVYRGATPLSLSIGGIDTLETRRGFIFGQYIDKMCSRRGPAIGDSAKAQTLAGLSSLARQMKKRAQTLFLVEGLQPDWLSAPAERWTYFLASRGIGALLLTAAATTIVTFWTGFTDDFLQIFLLFVVSNTLFVALTEALLIQRSGRTPTTPWKTVLQRFWIYAGLNLLLAEAACVLPAGENRFSLEEMTSDAVVGFAVAIFFGSLLALTFGFRGNRQSVGSDIQPVENLAWSWHAGLVSVPRGAIIAGLVVVTGVYSYYFILADALNSMGDARFHLSMLIPDWGALARFGGQGALVGAILAFLFGGVVRVATRSRTRPNEGIRLSSRNALRAGVLAALVQFAILTPALYLFRDPEHWLKGIWGSNIVADKTILIPASAAISGILLGVIVALWYGGFEIIQHYTLRLLLWKRKYVPAHLIRFLDRGSELIFLQKVGGGYIFIHRLLLDHFAAMEPKVPEGVPASKE